MLLYCVRDECWKNIVSCLYVCTLYDKIRCEAYTKQYEEIVVFPIQTYYWEKYGPPEYPIPKAHKDKEKREKQQAKLAVEKEKADKKRAKEKKIKEKIEAAELKRKKRLKKDEVKPKKRKSKLVDSIKKGLEEAIEIEVGVKPKRKRRTKSEMAAARQS